jgi:predicted secreted protein
MTITAALVMFAVCWFMTFFVVLPLRFQSQGDSGTIVPGTPASAPAGFVVKRKAWITTIAATIIWVILCSIILSGVITVRDFDVMGRMPPVSSDN